MDDIGNWDNYINNFLKANDVLSDSQAFVVVNVESVLTKDDNKNLRLMMENNQNTYNFDLNKTNAVFLKKSGVKSPKEILGKKIFFKKVLVRNPKTNQEVEGLRISKVE